MNFETTLTLSKPLNASRRKPGQRVTRAAIASPGLNTDASDDIQPDEQGTPKKIATSGQIKYWLRKKYPAMAEGKPLALGSHKQILKERDPLWSYHKTQAAIGQYSHSRKYLRALAEPGSRRFHLDGSDAGLVSDDHRDHAQELLKRPTKKIPAE